MGRVRRTGKSHFSLARLEPCLPPLLHLVVRVPHVHSPTGVLEVHGRVLACAHHFSPRLLFPTPSNQGVLEAHGGVLAKLSRFADPEDGTLASYTYVVSSEVCTGPCARGSVAHGRWVEGGAHGVECMGWYACGRCTGEVCLGWYAHERCAGVACKGRCAKRGLHSVL